MAYCVLFVVSARHHRTGQGGLKMVTGKPLFVPWCNPAAVCRHGTQQAGSAVDGTGCREPCVWWADPGRDFIQLFTCRRCSAVRAACFMRSRHHMQHLSEWTRLYCKQCWWLVGRLLNSVSLGGKTFFPIWKLNKMPQFYPILAWKEIQNYQIVLYSPDTLTKYRNFTWYLPEKLFHKLFFGEVADDSYVCNYGQTLPHVRWWL